MVFGFVVLVDIGCIYEWALSDASVFWFNESVPPLSFCGALLAFPADHFLPGCACFC